MLLVVTYSRAARTSLRNVRRAHEDCVVRWFGRAALFEATERGAFLALRLREKHPGEVGIERTEPFNEFELRDVVREAVADYAANAHPNTPYDRFAAGTDHPSLDELADRDL